eukprot:TRINITY_DN163_c0_g2_i7.p3 TRINITY_DN163_c0_g2~~TRINITY_DN163_c0_g2_i7.p3  ORF type:complete len:195 (-),score=34.86 TRINITY_DN163_c0_g2_i7:431-946(-)
MDSNEKAIAVRAVYKNVLGNAYLMESERAELAYSESCFTYTGNAKEFVRAVAQSDAYRTRYFEPVTPMRFVESVLPGRPSRRCPCRPPCPSSRRPCYLPRPSSGCPCRWPWPMPPPPVDDVAADVERSLQAHAERAVVARARRATQQALDVPQLPLRLHARAAQQRASPDA